MGVASERYDCGLLNSSDNFATFAAIRRASSFVSNLAAERISDLCCRACHRIRDWQPASGRHRIT
jgi:hypothetical protein